MTTADATPKMTDFFVSYTGKDQAWAEWIAWQLEAAGYTVVIQAWDFKSGGVFTADMHRALEQCARVIGVLSPNYVQSNYCNAEWLAAFGDDPLGASQRLILVRIAEFKPTGLLVGRTYIDLVGRGESQAVALLVERLKQGRAKPATPPGYPGSGPVGATKPAPAFPGLPWNNLPRLQPFFGRTDELRQIAEALEPAAQTWGALIDGPGGMGKTALAIRAAMNVAPGVFNRILFLSAKDREMDDDGERELTGYILSGWIEMLNEMARQLGQGELCKSAKSERPRLLLAALAGLDILLILDNVDALSKKDRHQLVNFVKRLPQGCKAILTSRRWMGTSADVLILTKLDQASALECLAEIAKHNPLLRKTGEAQRIELYEQTSGKPLLLRWVAGQLGRGNCRTIADALAFLRICPAENDPLEFIFGDLLDDFRPEETKVLVALIYFTQPTPVQHIAELAALSNLDSESALSTLANRSLIVPDPEEQHFVLVPMVADFLRKKRPEAVREVGDRLANRAYALILENGHSKYDRFAVLDAAWPTVAPALPLFLTGPNPRLQPVCHALRFFLEFTGRWDEWVSLEQQAEIRAVAADDKANAGWRAYQAGWVPCLRGQADAVLACAERAAAHWQAAAAGVRERSSAIQLRGHGRKLKKDYLAAVAAYRESLDLIQTLSSESEDVAIILNDLASAEQDSGDLEASERDYREALRVARAIDHADAVASCTGNLAGVALDREDWPGAETLAREALLLSENVGRRELIASNCRIIATALVRQGKHEEAVPYAQRAVAIYTPLRTPDLERARATLAECERRGVVGASSARFA